ncbi:hypothetical protein [Marinoscillum pacificum]|uniref:hypothetical protein n=1 Tax=Marinoscillum pacificum TaxID=392723 RepID=UPI0021572B8E|nr:hypothetical protein [Marinoscillum pacificum]
MLKVVNFLKFLSILLFLGILLLVYAYLPVMVNLTLDNSDLQLRKEDFFYFGIGVFVVVNLFFLGFQKLYESHISKLEVKAWVRGLSFVVNIYLTLIVGFIGVINNTAHLDPSGFAYLNYLGPFLIFIWVVGLIYLAKMKS